MKRHAMTIDLALGCDDRGLLVGLTERITVDTGAYASLGGPGPSPRRHARRRALRLPQHRRGGDGGVHQQSARRERSADSACPR